jgi:hypothetical protein
MTRKNGDVCPKCWHEDCDGNCQSVAERQAQLRREQAAAVAARLAAERKGRRR